MKKMQPFCFFLCQVLKVVAMRAFIAVVLFISFIGCRKDDDGEKKVSITEGIYKGTFTRTTTTGAKQCELTIQFTVDKFEAKEVGVAGYSGGHPYPIVGQGSYTLNGRKGDFNNYGFFTADFDWTVILNGKYTVIVTGKKVEIVREYESVPNGTLKDAYVLVKQ